ncbi:endonuclease/exonuclease/phosphatase family protein [Minicystis rosea]|nr:endonuclease/exonuclease/phosphatase family protein [Minicystis rosea]
MRKPGDRTEPGPPREKLRPSEEIHHQIRWDPRLDPAAFVIGYETRDARIEEVPYPLFVPGGEIPWHRIRYYRQGTIFVWDRRARIDRLPRARPASTERAAEAKPVHRSALALVPPEDVWAPIQAIRVRHDRHVERWMPHVNLLYGFVPESLFAEAKKTIAAALRAQSAFTVTLAEFRRFDHRASSTVWLRPESDPENALVTLQAMLEALFPRCNEQSRISASGFTPHLSIAQARGAHEAEVHMAAWQAEWQPIVFPVRSVELLARSGEEPFSVRASVPFGA